MIPATGFVRMGMKIGNLTNTVLCSDALPVSTIYRSTRPIENIIGRSVVARMIIRGCLS